jgi:ribosome-binding factor A
VREVIAEELERLSDPRLTVVTVTVTGIDVSPDLRHATVYYSSLGRTDEVRADVQTALDKAAPHLRQAVGSQVRMKFLPVLKFVVDPAIAAGARIEEILREDAAHRATVIGSHPDGAPDAATSDQPPETPSRFVP